MHHCRSGRRRVVVLLLAVTALAAAGGCSTAKKSPPALATADRSSLSLAESSVLDASDQLARARSDQLDIFAPRNMACATDALDQAQKLRGRGAPDADVLVQTSAVIGCVKAARDNRALFEKTLQETVAERKLLEDIGTPQALPKAYAKTLSMVRDLAETLESGNTAKALKEQQKVLDKLRDIEIDTLKQIHVVPAETVLDKADDINADDFAPVTYEFAERTIKSANKAIESNPRDRAAAKAAGDAALLAARKAYNVADEARHLVSLDQKKAEQRALYYFSLMERINAAGVVSGLDPLNLYDQATLIGKALDTRGGAASVVAVPPPAPTPAAAPAPVAVEIPVTAADANPASQPAATAGASAQAPPPAP